MKKLDVRTSLVSCYSNVALCWNDKTLFQESVIQILVSVLQDNVRL
jgi:hypothetical protein